MKNDMQQQQVSKKGFLPLLQARPLLLVGFTTALRWMMVLAISLSGSMCKMMSTCVYVASLAAGKGMVTGEMTQCPNSWPTLQCGDSATRATDLAAILCLQSAQIWPGWRQRTQDRAGTGGLLFLEKVLILFAASPVCGFSTYNLRRTAENNGQQ